ncbi:MAG: GNAT family N-acetyltransferase [Bacteroidota bacterium]
MKVEFFFEKNASLLTDLNATVHTSHQQRRPDVFRPYDREKFFPWFVQFLSKENTLCIFVKVEGKAIGYALITHRKPGRNPFVNPTFESWYIDQMSILEEFQNKGIGGQLIQFIKENASQRGINNLQLDVWSDNELAHHLYQKQGFNTIRQIMEYKMP